MLVVPRIRLYQSTVSSFLRSDPALAGEPIFCLICQIEAAEWNVPLARLAES